MLFARSLKAALAMSVCLLPLQAMAQSDDNSFDVGEKKVQAGPPPQPENWIQIGGQYNSARSFYLGRFTGTQDSGLYGLGDFHLGGRDAWDSGGTRYWSVDGKDMGFDSRSFVAKFGYQGSWGVQVSYDGIPYEATDNFHSVWTSNGSSVVPYGSIPLNNFPATPQYPAKTGVPYTTAGFVVPAIYFPITSPTLSSSLLDYNLSTRRDVFAGVGTYHWQDWTITASIRHEHKTGYQSNSLEIGGTVGLTGTGTGTSKNLAPATGLSSGLGYFAQPIDYDTDRYDVNAAYATERLQVQVGYMFSNFTDNIAVFNAVNPWALGVAGTSSFGGIAPGGANTTTAGISALYSLPPSNTAHQVKFMGGYNLTPTTRVTANFAYGLQMQNAAYAQGTGDPAYVQTLPRASFDGLVQTLYGNVAITSQPTPKLDVRVAYTIDSRDNQSPSNLYQVGTRSVGASDGDCKIASGGLSAYCANLPYSYEHQTFSMEAGYRILPQTKVTLNDTVESTRRSYADASMVTQNTTTLKARSRLDDNWFNAISISYQDRSVNNYVNGNTWALLTATGVNADLTPGFMVFSEAARRHWDVKDTIDWSPMRNLNISVMGKFAKDTYPQSQNGLRNNMNASIGPDVSWDINPNLSAHAYYTYQKIYYDTGDVYYSSGSPSTICTTGFAGCNGYVIPYDQQTSDYVHSAGVTLDWKIIPDVLKIGFNYTFSYGDTAYAIGDGMAVIGTGLTSQSTVAQVAQLQALPDIKSMLNMISIRGEYTFRPNWTMIFGYAFERFNYKDFMNVSSTQYANAIFPGTLNPNDSVHVVGAGLRVRF